MRRVLILLSVAIILLVAAANVYRDPRVQDLFRSAPRSGALNKPVVRTAPPANPVQPAPVERAAVPPVSAGDRVRPREPDVESGSDNQVPNETVSRVLMQILSARGLSRGVSLAVSDQSIEVFGEVDSNEKREAIIGLLEKGRESRRLDASRLTVHH